jgi:serine/threonine protein kinase
LSISPSLFCEHCGAANETEASHCCFCGHPLDEVEVKAPDTSSLTALDTLPIDTMLKGRYRIIKPVGQGGMGTVYRAQDTGLNDRAVAIKELIVNEPDAQDAAEAIEAFKREATLLAGLQHANLPSVFEHFKENGRWYMAMTFIQGETLEDHLEHTRSKKLPLHEVVEIGKQLSSVLYYLHTQYPPIIFRDVKPANVMRAPDGRIYLIDFGVARRFKSGQKKDTIPFGSIGYAAPEQFGKSQTTAHSDIYSLGATLYELLTGHDPVSTPLKFPPLRTLAPALPFKLVTLITQMLDHNESKRPANMLIVEQKLQEIESAPWQTTTFPSHSSTPTPPFHKPSHSAAPTPPSNRPSWRIVGTVGTFLLLLCLILGGIAGDLIGTSNATAKDQTNAAATAASNQTNATATAGAGISATATAVQVAALPDPYSPQGTLALFDPLSQANQWQEYTDTDFGGSCTFKDSALQIKQVKSSYFYYCDETNNAIFQNFTIEVKMAIIDGNCGGFVLRVNTDNSGKLYLFDICSDLSYIISLYLSNDGASATTLAKGNMNKLAIDFSDVTIAVVANHNLFDLYVNHQKITSLTDSSYSTGTVGLVADSLNSPTIVSYQDIKIWALP